MGKAVRSSLPAIAGIGLKRSGGVGGGWFLASERIRLC